MQHSAPSTTQHLTVGFPVLPGGGVPYVRAALRSPPPLLLPRGRLSCPPGALLEALRCASKGDSSSISISSSTSGLQQQQQQQQQLGDSSSISSSSTSGLQQQKQQQLLDSSSSSSSSGGTRSRGLEGSEGLALQQAVQGALETSLDPTDPLLSRISVHISPAATGASSGNGTCPSTGTDTCTNSIVCAASLTGEPLGLGCG